MSTKKLWVGIGAFVVVGSGVTQAADSGVFVRDTAGMRTPGAFPVLQVAGESHAHDAKATGTQATGTQATGTKAAGGEGGEGGEGGGEGGRAGLDPALQFYRDVELIRGHLLVANELAKEGLWNEALPHVLHPAEELYDGLKPQLATYNVKPFAAALSALTQAVKSKKPESFEAAYKLVLDQLAAVDVQFRAREPDWAKYQVKAALEVLASALGEYEEAVEKPEIEVVEYQDARGFVWQAEAMIDSVGPALEGLDAVGFRKLKEAFAELKLAWPTVAPPPKAVKDLSGVAADIARVELAAGAFL